MGESILSGVPSPGSNLTSIYLLGPPAFNSTYHDASVSSDLAFKQALLRYAYGHIMLVICLAGILGNALAFAVLSRRSMRSSATATYLRCLAVVDGGVLVLAIFRYRSYYILLSERDVIAVILNFDQYVQVYVVPFFWIFLGVSSFITLSLALERYLVIRWPFSLKKSVRVCVVRTLSAGAVVLVLLVTLPHFLCYRVHRATFRGLPVAAIVVSDDYLAARAYLHAYNRYLLPLLWYMGPWAVIAVVYILLSIQVRKSSRVRVGVPNSLNPNRNLSVLIILIVGVYMVCHFPRCILSLYCLVNRCSSENQDEGADDRAFHVVTVIAEILNILNSCLNIVVYCVTGSRFRREAKRLVLCRSCCHNSVAPSTPQSVHVSLREVPATPINSRKSFNMSYKELQMTRSIVSSSESTQGSGHDLRLPSLTSQPTLASHRDLGLPSTSSESLTRNFSLPGKPSFVLPKEFNLLYSQDSMPRDLGLQSSLLESTSSSGESGYFPADGSVSSGGRSDLLKSARPQQGAPYSRKASAGLKTTEDIFTVAVS